MPKRLILGRPALNPSTAGTDGETERSHVYCYRDRRRQSRGCGWMHSRNQHGLPVAAECSQGRWGPSVHSSSLTHSPVPAIGKKSNGLLPGLVQYPQFWGPSQQRARRHEHSVPRKGTGQGHWRPLIMASGSSARSDWENLPGQLKPSCGEAVITSLS